MFKKIIIYILGLSLYVYTTSSDFYIYGSSWRNHVNSNIGLLI